MRIHSLSVTCVLVLGACRCEAAEPAGARSGGSDVAAEESSAPLEATEKGCLPEVATLEAEVQQGVCYAHNYQDRGARGYGTETSRESHQELKALGVEWLSLTPFGFMGSIAAKRIERVEDYPGGETDEVMNRELALAKEHGFRVLLKPHIWIRGGAYRGQIEMVSDEAWDDWFASYRDFILHYARMAAAHDVAVFTVGVELDHLTQRFPERWRALIAEVREVYDGELVYAGNWDQVLDIPIWDAVDYAGIQFYPPLADDPGATETKLRERMAYYAGVLDDFYARVERPILFTEVGYRSVKDAELRPHAWPERDVSEPTVDERAQARAYRVFLNGIAGREWNAGVYFWKWFTDPNTREEGPAGFSPRGKLAEAALRTAYAGGECGTD